MENLQLDYVDVVFAHRPDSQTPLEEVCRGMDWIIEEGLAFYWATSEWSAEEVNSAMEICKRLKLHKPIADQCQYNAFCRQTAERSLIESYEEYGYGTTIWSPLAGGLLSGKYNDGNIPKGSRFDNNKQMEGIYKTYFSDDKKEGTIKILKGLEEIAKDVGCTQAQLVLAWTLVNQDISTCIFGASRTSQVQDNLKALEVAQNWSEDIEEKIEKVLGNQPEPPIDFNSFTPMEARRKQTVDYNMTVEGGSELVEKLVKASSE